MSYPRSCCRTVPGGPHLNHCVEGIPEAHGLRQASAVAVSISREVHGAVDAEMSKAVAKHGGMQTPAGGALSDNECLVILVEEIGEVARAMTYDEGDPGNLDKEILQVGTMALAWLQGRRLKREAELRDERHEMWRYGSDVPTRVMNGLGETVHDVSGKAVMEVPAIKVFDKLKEDTGEIKRPCFHQEMIVVHSGGCGLCAE